MALYIPTTFGSSGGGTIIASGSTSISGTIGMNSGWPLQQDYFVSNSITYSYWMWQGVYPYDATTGSTQNRTSNIATFDILSGSTLNARLVAIGGGGGIGGGQGFYNFPPVGSGLWVGNMAIGGGGAGGLVEFNNFPLIPGHYNIVAGAGGGVGFSGISSSITLPLAIAQPFTSSYIVAYGGGKSGVADRTSNSKGASGGSVGGNAQNPSNPNPIISNPVLGAGLAGRSGGDQGRTSGGIPESSAPNQQFNATATGGGGFAQSSAASSAGKYITDGGSGSLISIYPYNYNTASYVVTGGGAAGLPGNFGASNQAWQYSQQGGNAWGIGSGQSVSASIDTDQANYGMVYLEYPYYFNPYPKLATDGLMFRLSQTSLTGSVWYDLTDNGNNALISGSYLTNMGSGWNFNGINNYLTFPISMSGYPISQSFTLQWYGTKMNLGDVWYHASGSGNPTGWNYGANHGSNADWTTWQTGSNKTLYTLVQTNWGGTGSAVATYKLYINDSIFYAEYDTGLTRQYEAFQVPNIPLQFGYGTFSSSFTPDTAYLSGSASDLLFYNRPLDVSEIANNYKYLQTLPNVVTSSINGYRIAICNTTSSVYVNTTSSLAINDVINMSNYSSSYCFFVSASVSPDYSYPNANVTSIFTNCATCTGSIPPSPDATALLHYDANIFNSYPTSGSIWNNVGTLGNASSYQLTITGSTFNYGTGSCGYIQTENKAALGQPSAVLGATFSQAAQSTWLYCMNRPALNSVYQLIATGSGALLSSVVHLFSNDLKFRFNNSEINTTPTNNIASQATGSFISLAIIRTNTPVKRVEIKSSVDNFNTSYFYSSSTTNMNSFYDSLNGIESVVGSDVNIKSIKYYNSVLSTSQLLTKSVCPNC